MRRPRWGGVVLTALRIVWRADPGATIGAGVLQLVSAVSGLGVVLASKLALDSILHDATDVNGRMIAALVLLAAATAVSTSVVALQQLQQRLLSDRVDQEVWTRLMRVTASVDLKTWQSTDFMARLDRIRGNALQRPAQVVTAVFGFAGAGLGTVALVAALFALQPLLVPVLLAAGVPAVFFSREAGRREFAFVDRSNAANRQRWYLRRLLTDRLFAAEVRAFDSGPHLAGRHEVTSGQLHGVLRRHVRSRQLLALAGTCSAAVALAVALGVIVLLVHQGKMTLAAAGAAAVAARLLGGQLSTVFSSIGTLMESGPFLADLEDFVAAAADEQKPGLAHPLVDALRADDITFHYDGREAPALDRVSLSIGKGQVVALVGANGSGKSTLAKVVAGLFEPGSGKVTWDGQPLPLADLRAGVSVLFQDFVRYQMTGRDNITIAHPDLPVDEERVRAAAARADVDEVISALPLGYDTVLGLELADGSELSGGQWQRVALARAFYRDTPVVVLDEPTAALDARAEQALFSDVRAVLGGRAALLISHRFSSVRLADYIYVMDEGRVVEHGTHEELMNLPTSLYAELYTLQAAAYLR